MAEPTSTDELDLIAAVPGGPEAVEAALAAGADPQARDSDDWSALDHAAGGGHTEVVRVLLRHGADPTSAGREQRTPYQIALAAGRRDTAEVLREAEERADPASADRHRWRPYCRAYLLGELRRFPEWRETADSEALSDDSVVYLHDDGAVRRSIWSDDGVLHPGDSSRWEAFCRDELGFRVPDDFDLLP